MNNCHYVAAPLLRSDKHEFALVAKKIFCYTLFYFNREKESKMKISGTLKLVFILFVIFCGGCGLMERRSNNICQPGMTCWDKLSPAEQEMKRTQWLGQRQAMLQTQSDSKIHSLWAVKPVTSY